MKNQVMYKDVYEYKFKERTGEELDELMIRHKMQMIEKYEHYQTVNKIVH